MSLGALAGLAVLLLFVASCYGSAISPSKTSQQEEAASASDRPNIIFVLADDLDYTSAQKMPSLQSLLAEEGDTFAANALDKARVAHEASGAAAIAEASVRIRYVSEAIAPVISVPMPPPKACTIAIPSPEWTMKNSCRVVSSRPSSTSTPNPTATSSHIPVTITVEAFSSVAVRRRWTRP